jgi:hypothetical protein
MHIAKKKRKCFFLSKKAIAHMADHLAPFGFFGSLETD